MADLCHAFAKFHDRVVPSAGKEADLWAERNAIRRYIRNYFHSNLNVQIPKFCSHGSYAMTTMVNPLDGEYGLDEGVYLQHLNKEDPDRWPAIDIVHKWLIKATGGRMVQRPMDERTCVRVRLPGLYRVDLFCYGELNGQHILIDHGKPIGMLSDPLVLTQCFNNHLNLHGEQLRRIIRYIKAWADLQAMHGIEMLNGFILTILAASYYQHHARDDVALARTFQVIFRALSTVFMVPNPIALSEELTAKLSDDQKARFLEAVQVAASDASQAVAVDDDHQAARLWRKQLGDRFPMLKSNLNN